MNVDTDLIFVIGLVVGFLSFPALLSAYSSGRAPRSAAIMIMISIGLIATAVIMKPGGYSVDDAPDVFYSVVGRYVN